MIKHARKIAIVSSVGLLAACGMKLLWEARYDVSHQKAVQTLFLDAEGSSYVGVSQATSPIGDFLTGYEVEHRGLLLKYNSDGSLAWSSQVPFGESVAAVEQVGPGVVAIASKSFTTSEQGERQGGVWLVSTETGDVIQNLTHYEGGFHPESFKKMIAHDGLLYVAASTDCSEWQCAGDYYHSKIEVFDSSGNLVNSRVNDSAVIRDFDIADNGTISVALVSQQGELQQLDVNLNLQWTTTNNPVSAREMRHCGSGTVRFSGDSHVVFCGSSALKLDNAGTLLWTRSFQELLGDNRESIENIWSDESLIEIDSAGNIYFAKTRLTVYMGDEGAPIKIGNIDLYSPSTVESDAIIAKLDTVTGNILWSDDINTSIAIRDSEFTSHFYSPVAMNLSNGQVFLTTQAIIGTYTDSFFSDSSQYCNGYPGQNACSLVEYKDRYAKTFVYGASNGRRLGATKHSMTYARATKLDGAGNLLVAGDMNPLFSSTMASFVSLGSFSRPEQYLNSLIGTSDVILQKYKR